MTRGDERRRTRLSRCKVVFSSRKGKQTSPRSSRSWNNPLAVSRNRAKNQDPPFHPSIIPRSSIDHRSNIASVAFPASEGSCRDNTITTSIVKRFNEKFNVSTNAPNPILLSLFPLCTRGETPRVKLKRNVGEKLIAPTFERSGRLLDRAGEQRAPRFHSLCLCSPARL
jgi:hypothetical protein